MFLPWLQIMKIYQFTAAVIWKGWTKQRQHVVAPNRQFSVIKNFMKNFYFNNAFLKSELKHILVEFLVLFAIMRVNLNGNHKTQIGFLLLKMFKKKIVMTLCVW